MRLALSWRKKCNVRQIYQNTYLIRCIVPDLVTLRSCAMEGIQECYKCGPSNSESDADLNVHPLGITIAKSLLQLWLVSFRDHFVYAPSQCETTLHCNVVSHWLGTYTKWSLIIHTKLHYALQDHTSYELHSNHVRTPAYSHIVQLKFIILPVIHVKFTWITFTWIS